MNLSDILNRRSDLSTFLVHLTRSNGAHSAKDVLIQILRSRKIEARNVYGHLQGQTLDSKIEDKQKVVCFTETPLEYTYFLASEIKDRSFKFEPYGIALTKRIGREKGVNPVWYVDITAGHDWLTQQLDSLRDKFLKAPDDHPEVEALFPFFEQMGNGKKRGTGKGYCKEFWWEREWRHKGDFALPDPFICLCPEETFSEFEGLLSEVRTSAKCIDPRWSLERMIAHLAGFKSNQVEVIQSRPV